MYWIVILFFQTFDIAQGTSRIINRLVAPTANNCGKLLIARSNDIQISDLGEVTNQCAAGVHFSAKTARPPKNRVPARISAPEEIMIPKPKLLALSTYFAAILVCITFEIFWIQWFCILTQYLSNLYSVGSWIDHNDLWQRNWVCKTSIVQ